MSKEEEFSFDPPPEKAITTFFETPIEEAVKAHGPEDVDNLAETPLAYTEICEPMLKELYNLTQRRKAVVDGEKHLKEELKALVKLERGMIQRGQYGAKVTETKGKRHIDWQRAVLAIKAWAVDQVGAEAKKEIERIVAANEDPGVPTIVITPYMVGSEPEDDI